MLSQAVGSVPARIVGLTSCMQLRCFLTISSDANVEMLKKLRIMNVKVHYFIWEMISWIRKGE